MAILSTGVSLLSVNNGGAANIMFNTVADMKLANLNENEVVETAGFNSINDGGACKYQIISTGTANNMDMIALNNGKIAKALLLDYAYPDQLGYIRNTRNIGTTHNDVYPFIARILSLGIKHIKLHTGRYYINQSLTINDPGVSITGVARAAYDYPAMSRLLADYLTTNFVIRTNTYDIVLENFDLYKVGSVGENCDGIVTYGTIDSGASNRNINIKNLQITGFNNGILLSGETNWNVNVHNVKFDTCKIGTFVDTKSLVINFKHCYFNNISNECVHLQQYQTGISFDDCNFGCRNKAIKIDWYGYDFRNFGELTFKGCNFEVDKWYLDGVHGCFIDIDNNVTVSAIFIGCAFNPTKANPTTSCFKLGNKTRISMYGCHGDEDLYSVSPSVYFDTDYPPELNDGTLFIASDCYGIPKPEYNNEYDTCVLYQQTLYKSNRTMNLLNLFDNNSIYSYKNGVSYVGVAQLDGVWQFISGKESGVEDQYPASIVYEVPDEYLNTNLTISAYTGTHNRFVIVGSDVHPDVDRTTTAYFISNTYSTGDNRDYVLINPNGHKYITVYYYSLPETLDPLARYGIIDGFMISVGNYHYPFVKHWIYNSNNLYVSREYMPTKLTRMDEPPQSGSYIITFENGVPSYTEVNTFINNNTQR